MVYALTKYLSVYICGYFFLLVYLRWSLITSLSSFIYVDLRLFLFTHLSVLEGALFAHYLCSSVVKINDLRPSAVSFPPAHTILIADSPTLWYNPPAD